MRTNNINMDQLNQTMQQAQADPAKAKHVTRIEGRWNLGEGLPQFTGVITYQSGSLTLDSDQPISMGGSGTMPAPLHYCVYGLTACYVATFATMAALMQVHLKRLEAVTEAYFDLSQAFGLGDSPALEHVAITLTVDSDADRAQLDQVQQMANERCPAMYILGHQVPFHSQMKLLQPT